MEIQAIKANLHRVIDEATDADLLKSVYNLLVQETDGDSKEAILNNIRRGIEEVKLAKQGKLKTTPAKNFFNELHS